MKNNTFKNSPYLKVLFQTGLCIIKIMLKNDLFLTMSRPYALSFLLGLITIITVIALFNPDKMKHPPGHALMHGMAVCLGIGLFMTISSIFAMNTVATGIRHGMFDPETGLAEIRERIPLTPEESDLANKDLSDTFILFFRFGCSDCEAVYPNLQEIVQNRTDWHWVSTRSEQGEELLEEYPIDEVPSLVYIYPDGTRFAVFKMHIKNEHGNIALNHGLLNAAFRLKEGQVQK